jgi:hypothetical protein
LSHWWEGRIQTAVACNFCNGNTSEDAATTECDTCKKRICTSCAHDILTFLFEGINYDIAINISCKQVEKLLGNFTDTFNSTCTGTFGMLISRSNIYSYLFKVGSSKNILNRLKFNPKSYNIPNTDLPSVVSAMNNLQIYHSNDYPLEEYNTNINIEGILGFVSIMNHLVDEVNRLLLSQSNDYAVEMQFVYNKVKLGHTRINNLMDVYCINKHINTLNEVPKQIRTLVVNTLIKAVRLIVRNRHVWFEESKHLDQTIYQLYNIIQLLNKHLLIDDEIKYFQSLHVICIDGFIMEGKTEFIQHLADIKGDEDSFSTELDAFYRTYLKGDFLNVDVMEREKKRLPLQFYKSFAALGYICSILKELYTNKHQSSVPNTIHFDRSFISHDTFEILNVDYRSFFFNLINVFSEKTEINILFFNHLLKKNEDGEMTDVYNVPWPFKEKRIMELELYKTRESLEESCSKFYEKYNVIADDFFNSITC